MKNKKILILSIIFTILITILVLLILFFKTNLFKSNKQLFFENTANVFQFTKDFNLDEFIEQEKALSEKSKIKKGIITLDIDSFENNISKEEKEIIKNSYLGYIEKQYPEKNYSEFMLGAYHNKNKIESITFIRDNDKYGLYCKDLCPKCIYFENNDLKKFIEKFGFDSTYFPDKFESFDVYDQYNINKELSEEIFKKYFSILYQKLDNKKFYKNKNVDTTINNENIKTTQYSLTLSKKEIIDIQIAYLEDFKNDTDFLNKYLKRFNKDQIGILKTIYINAAKNSNSENTIGAELFDITEDSIKQYIDEVLIKQLNAQKENEDSNENYTFNVYPYKNNSSKFEIITPEKNQNNENIVISLEFTKKDNESNIINLNISNYMNINLSYQKTLQNESKNTSGILSVKSDYNSVSSSNDENIFNINFNIENSENLNKYNFKINLLYEPKGININNTNKTKNISIEINSETSGIIGQDTNTKNSYINTNYEDFFSSKVIFYEVTNYTNDVKIDTSKFEDGLCINKLYPKQFPELFNIIKQNFYNSFAPKFNVYKTTSKN